MDRCRSLAYGAASRVASAPGGLPVLTQPGSPCNGRLELVQPKMRSAVVALRLPPFVAPVPFAEWRIRHVGGWRHIRRPRCFRPLRPHAWPIIVREIVIWV